MNNTVQYQRISEEEEGQRIDNYLFRCLKGVPKSHIYRIIRQGEVRVNKKRVKPEVKLKIGDAVRIPPIRTSDASVVVLGEDQRKRLEQAILYEDHELLVINKPAGMAVHGGSGVSLGVIEALRQVRPALKYLELAHRLDKETSGCLILVKKKAVLRSIQQALIDRTVTKLYWLLSTASWTTAREQTIRLPLKKNHLQSGERVVKVDPEGKSAETCFKLIESYSQGCWIEAYPKTGRTHQIRVHAAAIGHPIWGDQKYGDTVGAKRLCLHAYRIQFTLNGQLRSFEAQPDNVFLMMMRALKKE